MKEKMLGKVPLALLTLITNLLWPRGLRQPFNINYFLANVWGRQIKRTKGH